MSFIHHLWRLPQHRYARLALKSLRQLASARDTSCWYAETSSWFKLHSFSMDNLPPFQFSLDAPSITLTRSEINRIVRCDLTELHVKETWITFQEELGTKMHFYRDNLLCIIYDDFIIQPKYMDVHLLYGNRCAIRQMRKSSHQPHIEIGRYGPHALPTEERIYQLYGLELETKEHYICRCPIYYKI